MICELRGVFWYEDDIRKIQRWFLKIIMWSKFNVNGAVVHESVRLFYLDII